MAASTAQRLSRAQQPPPPSRRSQDLTSDAASLPGLMSNAAEPSETPSSLHDVELQSSFGLAILDIASVRPPPADVAKTDKATEAEPASDDPAPPAPPDPAELARLQRVEELDQLAGYGPPPRNLLYVVPYFVRVMLRRREVEEALSKLTVARTRLDAQVDEALCAVAEALVLREAHASLDALRETIYGVLDRRKLVSSSETASREARERHKAELTRIKSAVAKVEAEAVPVRARETEQRGVVDGAEAILNRYLEQQRKLAAELDALGTSKDPEAAARIPAVRAELDRLTGPVRAKQTQLAPLRAELEVVQAELTTLLERIKGLRDDEREAMRAMEREQQRHRASTEGAKGAHRDALRALARAAQEQGLASLVSKENQAWADAVERARQQRDREELQRAAMQSFDAVAYQRGMQILIGGTAAIFLLLLALILF
jgi:hypothetical protein